jgi:hypothetical protein
MLPSSVQDSGGKNTGPYPGPLTGPAAHRAPPPAGKSAAVAESPIVGKLAPSDEELRLQYHKLRQAVADEPDVPGHRLLLGDLCLRLGRKEEAKAILFRAVERQPESRAAVLDLLRGHLSESELAKVPVGADRRPFYQDAAGILEYPFRGNGPVLLIGGGVVFTGLAILARITLYYCWIPGLLSLGYLASYMMSVIETSSRGNRQPPDYPDFASWFDSIMGPFWIFLSTLVIPFALPIAWIATFGLGLGFVPFLLVGLVYWPMGLMTGAILQSAEAPLNALMVVRAIRASAREYFPAVLVIYGMVLVSGLVALLISQILPFLFAEMVAETLGLYFLLVEMHILGRVYQNNSGAIGWFEPKEAAAPLPPPGAHAPPPAQGRQPPAAPRSQEPASGTAFTSAPTPRRPEAAAPEPAAGRQPGPPKTPAAGKPPALPPAGGR